MSPYLVRLDHGQGRPLRVSFKQLRSLTKVLVKVPAHLWVYLRCPRYSPKAPMPIRSKNDGKIDGTSVGPTGVNNCIAKRRSQQPTTCFCTEIFTLHQAASQLLRGAGHYPHRSFSGNTPGNLRCFD